METGWKSSRKLAQQTAADAQSPHHLGLVTDADLPQFDAGAENPRQIPHQFPEVHPPVGGEKENNLGAVKAGGYVHQLHFKAVLRDFLLADVKGLALFSAVIVHGAAVGIGGRAQHGAQGLDDRLVRHLVVALRAGAEFRPLGGFHDDLIPHLYRKFPGIEIVILASAPKADADNFSQRMSSNSTAKAPNTWLTPTL